MSRSKSAEYSRQVVDPKEVARIRAIIEHGDTGNTVLGLVLKIHELVETICALSIITPDQFSGIEEYNEHTKEELQFNLFIARVINGQDATLVVDATEKELAFDRAVAELRAASVELKNAWAQLDTLTKDSLTQFITSMRQSFLGSTEIQEVFNTGIKAQNKVGRVITTHESIRRLLEI